MSNLVEHAKRELELSEETDEEFKKCIIKAIGEFARYGHSGSSAWYGMHILNELLQFKNLSPLTNDPKEWNEVGEGVWQSSRNAEAFSNNGGKTYYLLSEGANFKNPKPWHRTKKVKAT